MPVRNPNGNGVANKFIHGSIVVGTTPVRISSVPTPLVNGLMLLAHKDNTGVVFIGKDDQLTQDDGGDEGEANFNDGLPFQKGDSYTFQIDEMSDVWLVASEEGQVMYFLGD